MTDVVITRGDTKIFKISVKDGSDNSAIDLAGYTVFFTVKEDVEDSDSDALISKTQYPSGDTATGITSIYLTSTETNLDPGSYKYDIQLKTPATAVHTVVKGSLIVEADVTRRES